MKKVFALVAIVLTLATPTVMQAQEGCYAGVQGGVNFLDSHFLKERCCRFDTGYNVGVVGGYAWCIGWHLESEITYHYNRYSLNGTNKHAEKTRHHGNVHTWSAMLNGYYDIPIWKCWRIEPYVGAGVGADYVHQSMRVLGEKFKGSNTGFAWQVMAGINYFLLEDVALSAEYKFHMAPLRHGHHLQNQSVILGIKKFFCFCF
jgi:OmpA-OmpF porin, OOP family